MQFACVVYAGIFKHQKIISKYENLMVAICVCTRHIPPYTNIYRHMTVYVGICRDIRVTPAVSESGFQMRCVLFPKSTYEYAPRGKVRK
jgi:hypothetical protein